MVLSFKNIFLPLLILEVFIICDTTGLKNIKSWFGKGNPFGYDITHILNIDGKTSQKVYREIDSLVNDEQYDSAVIDIEDNESFQMQILVDHLQTKVRRIILLPKMSKTPMFNGELISSLHHKGMAFYLHNHLLSPFDRAAKQLFDFTVAACLVLLTSPFTVAVYRCVYLYQRSSYF